MSLGRVCRSGRTASRRAFTLLEVMLALVVGVTVLLMARGLMEQLNEADRALDLATRAESRTRNRMRVVARAFDRLEVGTSAQRTFVGAVGEMTFTSWCDTPRGWLERCNMRLRIDTSTTESLLLLQSSLGDSVVIRRGFGVGSFRYIDDVDDPKGWVWHWGPGDTAPMAVAVLAGPDTLLFRIGPRG